MKLINKTKQFDVFKEEMPERYAQMIEVRLWCFGFVLFLLLVAGATEASKRYNTYLTTHNKEIGVQRP